MKRNFDRKEHWEQIYLTKQPNEVSWFQPTPGIFIDLINEINLPSSAKILDVGGGDGILVDALLEAGYQNISVLDISEAAIERARLWMGERARQVKWIVADITNFITEEKYDLLHDRAAFHFLTEQREVAAYVGMAENCLTGNGVLIMATFSDEGPKRCGGIEIRQYSEADLTDVFKNSFNKIKCIKMDHHTPFDTSQNFVFCSFRRMAIR